MTSILLSFAVPIHEFSTFLLGKKDIISQHHYAKNISYVLFCDNCTALVVCPYMRIFPLLNRSDVFLAPLTRRQKNSNDIRAGTIKTVYVYPLSNLCSVQVAYEGQFIHILVK